MRHCYDKIKIITDDLILSMTTALSDLKIWIYIEVMCQTKLIYRFFQQDVCNQGEQ